MQFDTTSHGRGPVDAVEAGEADIAAMSAGAAHDLAAAGSGHLLPPLDPGTYYAPSTLVVADRPDPPERARIGIDPAPTAVSSSPMRRQHPRHTADMPPPGQADRHPLPMNPGPPACPPPAAAPHTAGQDHGLHRAL